MYKIIGGDQREYGPITSEQLRQWIAEGRANGQTKVQTEGSSEWKPHGSIPELASALGPPPLVSATTSLPSRPMEVSSHIPNYLVQSILCTLCCCLPLGIVAIVYAAQVNSKLAAGDHRGALDASQNARTWCWVAFALGLISCSVASFLSLASSSFDFPHWSRFHF
jgi:hypothetical protein